MCVLTAFVTIPNRLSETSRPSPPIVRPTDRPVYRDQRRTFTPRCHLDITITHTPIRSHAHTMSSNITIPTARSPGATDYQQSSKASSSSSSSYSSSPQSSEPSNSSPSQSGRKQKILHSRRPSLLSMFPTSAIRFTLPSWPVVLSNSSTNNLTRLSILQGRVHSH